MKKHSTLPSRIISLLLLVTTSALFIYSCKRENDFSNRTDLTIEKAKDWFEQNYSANTYNTEPLGQNEGSTETVTTQARSKTSKIGKFIMWDSHQNLFVDGTHYLAVDISNGSIKFTNGRYGTRLALFSMKSASEMKMHIIEILSKNLITKSNLIQTVENIIRVKKGFTITHKIEQELSAILYSENYKYLESFTNKNNRLESKNLKILKRGKLGTQAVSIEDFSTTDNCELWEVVLITYNEDGSVAQEDVLYTYYVGQCDNINNPNNQDDPGDYGGGDDEINYEHLFNQYVSMEIRPAFSNGPTTEPNSDPVTDVVTWKVAEASYAGWQILADTRFSYMHDTYFDVINMSLNHVYTFSQYSTTNSRFIGSHTFIESTWNQSSVVDQVLNNGTPSAKGRSRVTGSIRHKTKIEIEVPYIGRITLDRTFNIPGNTLEFIPH